MTRNEKLKHGDRTLRGMLLAQALAPAPPAGPTATAYRIANYADGLVGENGCDALRPQMDSGLCFADPNHLQPGDPCWDSGVAGGVTWDGTFYRDLARYAAGGNLFWSAYLKPGSAPGMKGGFWLNFGSGWAHLQNDDPAQMSAGAAPRIFHDPAAGGWKLVIEATRFVTFAVVEVWTGVKSGGNDPEGRFTRVSGADPLAALTVCAA